jgi:hypothetical protein
MSTYGYLYIPTGECVHFIDECPELDDLEEIAREAQSKRVRLVYLDCADFTWRLWDIPNRIGASAGTAYPPYDADSKPHWIRWWDDLLSLGHNPEVTGLAIVLDIAFLAFEKDRKFMTTLLESFLHGMKSWIKSEKPYHLHFQMVPCARVGQVFGSTAAAASDA